MASEDSNISEDVFHANDEVIHGKERINYEYATVDPFSSTYEIPVSDQLFVIQSKIIKLLSQEGPCVIVGRCSDLIVEDPFNVFICASLKSGWSGFYPWNRIRTSTPKKWRPGSAPSIPNAGTTTSITAAMNGGKTKEL